MGHQEARRTAVAEQGQGLVPASPAEESAALVPGALFAQKLVEFVSDCAVIPSESILGDIGLAPPVDCVKVKALLEHSIAQCPGTTVRGNYRPAPGDFPHEGKGRSEGAHV